MATKIRKNIKTCKSFLPASAFFVNSATVFVNSATPRGHAPAPPRRSLHQGTPGHHSPGVDCLNRGWAPL